MERISSCSLRSIMASPVRPTRRSGRPTGNRWHSTGTWQGRCRCSCWTYARVRSVSSPRWGVTRIRPGRPTVVTSPSFPTGQATASCGSSILKPAVSGRCCSRAGRVCRPGLHGFRRLLLPPPNRRDRMKSVSLLLVFGLGAAVIAGAACGGNPPPQAPTPNADSAAAAARARADSEAAAQAERDRQAAAERERAEQQRRADSLAALARSSEEVRTTLATMIHFDYDKSDRKSTRLNSSHLVISYAVFCLKKKKINIINHYD